jgi:hypothetical protein
MSNVTVLFTSSVKLNTSRFGTAGMSQYSSDCLLNQKSYIPWKFVEIRYYFCLAQIRNCLQPSAGAGVAQSVQCLTTGWMTGRSGFDPRQRQRIFPLSSVSRPALRPTQPPVQWVPGVLSPGVKARPGRDADHSPLSSAEVVNE